MKVVGTSIREDQVDAIDEIARERQVNRSIVIRWAIDHYLKSLFLPVCPVDRTNGHSIDQQAA